MVHTLLILSEVSSNFVLNVFFAFVDFRCLTCPGWLLVRTPYLSRDRGKESCFLVSTTFTLLTFSLTFNIDSPQNLAHKIFTIPCTRKSYRSARQK